jgi:hypothetical protein
MSAQDYPSWEVKPHSLTREEVENPLLVFHEFFSFGHMPDIREQMWELLKALVTGNYCRLLTRRERSDMVYFYEKLEKLVEAAHIVLLNQAEQEIEKNND